MDLSLVFRWRRALQSAWAPTEVDGPDTLVLCEEDLVDTVALDDRRPHPEPDLPRAR